MQRDDDDDDDTAEKASTDNLPLPEMRIRRRPSEYIILMDDREEGLIQIPDRLERGTSLRIVKVYNLKA